METLLWATGLICKAHAALTADSSNGTTWTAAATYTRSSESHVWASPTGAAQVPREYADDDGTTNIREQPLALFGGWLPQARRARILTIRRCNGRSQILPPTMSESDPEPKRPEIKSDADWKARVKAEDAQMDAKRAGPTAETAEQGPSRPDIDASQLPKPDFSTLVGMFSTQAMVALGLIPDPVENTSQVQLSLARHFIDLLAVVEEKTVGNLSDAEQRFLEQALHELRMAFVEQSKAATDSEGAETA